MKKTKETKADRETRLAKIESLFDEIKILVLRGQLDEAMDLRYEADKLRIDWRVTR